MDFDRRCLGGAILRFRRNGKVDAQDFLFLLISDWIAIDGLMCPRDTSMIEGSVMCVVAVREYHGVRLTFAVPLSRAISLPLLSKYDRLLEYVSV